MSEGGADHQYNQMSGVVQCRYNPTGLAQTFGFAGDFNYCPFCGADLAMELEVDANNPPLIE